MRSTERVYRQIDFPPLTDAQKKELETLRNMKEEEINTDDIPEVDFSDAAFHYAVKIPKKKIYTAISEDNLEWLMMKDLEVRKEYYTLEAEFQLVRAMIKARYDAGLTQKELAAKTGIQQANISRIENGNGNPSISTLYKLAEGLEKKIVL